MFGRIAGRYDLMNSLMTAGLDRGWRSAAVQAAAPPPSGLVLDVGTGTARLAAVLARVMPAGLVVGLDFAEPMLQAGQRWLWATDQGEQVVLVVGDALALPFADATFDCLTSAFAVRNLADLEHGMREQVRVVKPGGRVVCLELTWPRSAPLQAGLRAYGRYALPLLGRLIAGDAAAYRYLPASIELFPPPERLAAIMLRCGLSGVRWRRLGFGTVALHVGQVPTRD
jgi:demethylmenaquinone methyltransferase/2-methoxy-6-polyprenyl-1,4-benzoquinol methylase